MIFVVQITPELYFHASGRRKTSTLASSAASFTTSGSDFFIKHFLYPLPAKSDILERCFLSLLNESVKDQHTTI